MAFDKINSRAQQNGKSTAYEGNKYEDPLKAMDLVAHILRAQNGLDLASYFNPFIDAYNEFGTKFDSENGKWQWESNSVEGLRSECFEVAKAAYGFIEEGLKNNSIKVAVAGGFSAGKSSLINSILNMEGVLPTGIEPVSMINTYICPTSEVNKLQVVGNNVRNCLVKLDEEVLGAIKHSDRSNVYVSSVLNSLYVDVPVPQGCEYLENITFIDTPGYNNSKSINFENAISDSDSANRALNDADAIIWTIDIEAGVISNNDIAFLNNVLEGKNENFPVVILFNKIDKKSPDDIKRILETALDTCQRSLKVKPLDVVGYSSDTLDMWSCDENYTMESLFGKIRNQANNACQDVNFLCSYLTEQFSEQLKNLDEVMAETENLRKETADEKSKAFNREDYDFDELQNVLHGVMVENYQEVLDALFACYNQLNDAYNGWSDSLDREVRWSSESGFFSDTSSLVSECQNGMSWYNRTFQQRPNCSYWNNEQRESIFSEVKSVFDYAKDRYNDSNEEEKTSLEENYKKYKDHLNSLKTYKKEIEGRKDTLVNLFLNCCSQALSARRQYVNSLPTIGQ